MLSTKLKHTPKILYVEDHDDTRELVRMILAKQSFEITTAGTLREGTRLAREEQFDLYLLDLWLPDGEGSELARSIREFDSATPIVFFSAAAYENDRLEALRAGAQAYLSKPAVPSEICDVITGLIEFGELSAPKVKAAVS